MTAQVALAARAATSNVVRTMALGERVQSVATDRRSLWGSVSGSRKACCRIPLVSPQSVILSFGDQFGFRGRHSHKVIYRWETSNSGRLFDALENLARLLVDIVNSGSTTSMR